MKEEKRTRILLAEDHTSVRQAFIDYLERIPEFQIVAQVERGADLSKTVSQHRPDLLLLDLQMERGFNPTQAVPRLREIQPNLKVLVLTAVSHPRQVIAMMDAGADGYVHKSERLPTLVSAIRSVMAGDIWLSDSLGQLLVEGGWVRDLRGRLDQREIHILENLAAGKTINAIALDLTINERRVYEILAEIREKLGAQSNSQAVALAVRMGLID
jgi:DNA-binding NarL/FixJ family response regulator